MKLEMLIEEFNKTQERQSKLHVNAQWFTNYGFKLQRLLREMSELATIEKNCVKSSDKQDSNASEYMIAIGTSYTLRAFTSRSEKTYFYSKIESA